MIEKQLIDKINELANKEKKIGLTLEEKKEQQKLREEYLKQFKNQFRSQLKNIKVIDKEGNDITPEKLKAEKKGVN